MIVVKTNQSSNKKKIFIFPQIKNIIKYSKQNKIIYYNNKIKKP